MTTPTRLRLHGLDIQVESLWTKWFGLRWYVSVVGSGEVYSSSSRQRAIENCLSDNISNQNN